MLLEAVGLIVLKEAEAVKRLLSRATDGPAVCLAASGLQPRSLAP